MERDREAVVRNCSCVNTTVLHTHSGSKTGSRPRALKMSTPCFVRSVPTRNGYIQNCSKAPQAQPGSHQWGARKGVDMRRKGLTGYGQDEGAQKGVELEG